MKLLWLTERYFPNRGGMAQSCDRITYFLRQADVEIDIVHFTNRRKAFEWEITTNGKYIACPIDHDISHQANLLWNALSADILNKHDYSFIVAYGGLLPLWIAPVYAKWMQAPLMCLLRGNDFDSYLFSLKKREVLYQAMEESVCVCCVSSLKKQKLQQLFPEKNIEYIPNGIETDMWQVSKSDMSFSEQWKRGNTDPNHKVIGLIGHLKDKKGMDFFLQALKKSGALHSVHLLIIGDILEETQLFLHENIPFFTCLHFLDSFELIRYYPVCDCIAIPSYYDGMPNVMLEAGSLGIPVLASNIDGMKDVLEDAVSGFLFYPGNSAECIKAIREFVKTPHHKLKQMGLHLMSKIKSGYTAAIECENYIKVFRKYIGGHESFNN